MVSTKYRKFFTLVELLVVIAIIAILAGLLLPTLNKSRQKAKITECTNNLRQLGTACIMYKDDFHNQMPPWISTLYRQYTSSTKIYRCPDDLNPATTAYNAWISRPEDRGWDKFTEAYDRPGNEGKKGNDPNVLIDQNDASDKPKQISYFYEFNESICTWQEDAAKQGLTWNEVKEIQIREQGDEYPSSTFPAVRCFWHVTEDDRPVYNVSIDGNVFQSLLEWEKGTW